ncbi:MAG: amidohydrolase family protein [Candidatus Micrarchaeia archaeon]
MKNIVINSDKMFDGYKITDNVSILIIDGIITKIGKRGEFKGKTLNTKFILPGLIDMHIHLSTYGGLYYKSIKLIPYFNKMLIYNGITTVRDLGNSLNNVYNFEHYDELKPKIFYSLFLDSDKPLWSMSFIIKNKKQIPELIKMYSETGIKWVKAYRGINPKILKEIIKEAHHRGLKVAGDLLTTKPIDAINMNIDTLEHVVMLINETYGNKDKSIEKIYKKWASINLNSKSIEKLINNLVISKTVLCPTLILSQMELFPSLKYSEYLKILFPLDKIYTNKKTKNNFSKINYSVRKNAFKNMLKLIKKLNENGVKLISGTDSGNPYIAPGFSMHQELKLLVNCGLTPIEALKCATTNAAAVLGNEKIGQIKDGYKADIILLTKDVEYNIANIDKISHVILDGKIKKINIKNLRK